DPVREILVELIDFDGLKGRGAIPLFIAATNLRDGGRRIFTNAELSPDVLIASACLPTLHHAVKLDDGHYWDGGFSANPPLLPLLEQCDGAEILLVHVNPMTEPDVPMTAREIHSRLNNIVFNGPVKRELEMIAWLRSAIERAGGRDSPLGKRLAQLKIHSIGADELMRRLGTASKLNPDWRFVTYLKQAGEQAAERWLEDVFGAAVEPLDTTAPARGGAVAPFRAPSR
ncbi:MAG TPA: patatin-like phospholipase family protein, partial [Steroidobacteraceae bacterium]|nr:patatin-like phospholipase family protein [Steroidobacteraceae bacterium]